MSEIYKVTTTRCIVSRGGQGLDHCDCDTIFIDQIPHVVFEWEPQPDGSRKPIHLVRLDPQYLRSMSASSDSNHMMYQLPIEDPRPLD